MKIKKENPLIFTYIEVRGFLYAQISNRITR